MNLSHIIHEFSFGPFFPAIAQPLDMTYVKTEESEFRVRVLSNHITSHQVASHLAQYIQACER
jgi:hypothetical protein